MNEIVYHGEIFSKNEDLYGRNFETAHSARKELDCIWSVVRNFVERNRNSSAYNSMLLPSLLYGNDSWNIRRNINAECSANGAFGENEKG